MQMDVAILGVQSTKKSFMHSIYRRIRAMRYPKNIQQGGTIGFVAPSFGCQIEPYYSAFGNAQKKFREMGYQLQL